MTELAAEPLERKLEQGGCVLLLGRESGEYGRRTYEAAALDAIGAANSLAALGLDYRHLMPSKNDLIEALREAPAEKSVRSDGSVFHNTFVELDLRRAHGLMVLVSAGSGKKIDDECVQPFAQRAADLARTHRPTLTFGRRFDRWVRRAWGLAPLMLQLEEQPEAYVGDGRNGIHRISTMSSLMIFFATSVGQEEAEKLPVQTRDGMVRHTETEFVDGRCIFGLAHAAPPGLARARLRDGTGAGRSILFLDDPKTRPGEDEAAYGLPQVFDSQGEPVDQTANVMFALDHLGKPGWSRRRIAEELSARQFSTDGYRRTHGPAAAIAVSKGDPHVYRFLRSIIDNLDVYETGKLTCALGVAGYEPVTISNIWPRGRTEWASGQRFAEIRRYLADLQRSLVVNRVALGFSGVTARVNGIDAVLLSATKQSGATQPLHSYKAVRADEYPNKQIAVPGQVRVPHALLAEAVVAGLEKASETPLKLLVPEDGSDEVSRLRAELHQTKTTLERHRAEQDGIFARLNERTDDGRLVVGEALTRRLDTRYQELEALIESLEDTRDDLTSRLRTAEDDATVTGQHLERLLHVVASLRDATDLRYRDAWITNMVDLVIDTERVEKAAHTGTRTTVRGTLSITDDGAAYAVPFEAQRLEGPITELDQRVEAAVRQMRDGVPFWETDVLRHAAILPLVARYLDANPRTFVAANIEDPRILRTVMLALYTKPDAGPEEIARELGEPEDFTARVLDVHRNRKAKRAVWRNNAGAATAGLFASACKFEGRVAYANVVPTHFMSRRSLQGQLASDRRFKNEWDGIYGEGYQLKPCVFCQSARRAPLAIPEPVGSVCLDCRRDRRGILWPAKPYDSYVIDPGMWVAAGLVDARILEQGRPHRLPAESRPCVQRD